MQRLAAAADVVGATLKEAAAESFIVRLCASVEFTMSAPPAKPGSAQSPYEMLGTAQGLATRPIKKL